MSNYYLEKFAKKVNEEHKAKAYVLGAGAQMGVALVGSVPALSAMGDFDIKSKVTSHSDQNLHDTKSKLIQAIKKDNINYRENQLTGLHSGYSPFKDPKTPHNGPWIQTSSSVHPAIASHEYGHHMRLAGKTLSRTVPYLTSMNFMRLGLPVIATAVADPDSVVSKYAPIGTAALAFPMLHEEFQASRLGVKKLRELGMNEANLAKSKNMLSKAFLTYGGLAAGNILGSVIARNIRRKELKNGQ